MVLRGLPTELDLFLWLKKHYYPDLRSNAGEYSFYDAWSAEFRFYAELKARSTHYETLIIEKAKYDRIVKIGNANRFDALYICSTPQGVWQFDVALLSIVWEDMPGLPVTSQFENNERVTKTVGLLPLQAGIRLGEATNRRKGGGIYGNR